MNRLKTCFLPCRYAEAMSVSSRWLMASAPADRLLDHGMHPARTDPAFSILGPGAERAAKTFSGRQGRPQHD